jgi:hypothetical protein
VQYYLKKKAFLISSGCMPCCDLCRCSTTLLLHIARRRLFTEKNTFEEKKMWTK